MIVYQSGSFGGPQNNFTTDKNSDSPPPPPRKWWLGKKLTCSVCGCVFGVKEGDTLTTDCLAFRTIDRQPQVMLSVLCPECRLLNRFAESDAEEMDPFEPTDADEFKGGGLL